MDFSKTTRRSFLSLALAAPVAAGVAACGSSGPKSSESSSGSAASGTASMWSLSGKPQETVRQANVDAFNKANPNSQIKLTLFANDDYKTKIKTALGAGQAPTIMWGWGGGGLKSWVDAGQVEDLTSWFGENAAVKDKIFPSAFGAATIDDKLYAIPTETVTPIVFYWNKEAFDKIGQAAPPQSWAEIMSLVPRFNAKNIAPFSLAGGSRWTNMMWLEFLFDRIGGSEVFDAIFAGEKDAWNNPAAIDALTKTQELVKAKGFQKGFSSTVADQNADQALLYTGKAAMMVHGAWTYGSMKDQGGKFVSGGNLGYMNFPPVEGGKGDPSDTVGNPGQYLSISSKATDAEKEVAKKFFTTQVNSAFEQKEWVGTGSVPVVKGSDSLFTGAKDADWLKFIYDTSANAKVFAQSWDQALSPAAAEVLLDNIAKLFQLKVTPQQFATNLNKVTNK
ncbi:extracellular solute-binding protein [Spongisporangium articulatum]|uniref:Extracellular solute-binding protein n=1 Tax=Spongisporangium articulatum TaxID=3362603 RepID=A0ABW8ANC1_9ACTN